MRRDERTYLFMDIVSRRHGPATTPESVAEARVEIAAILARAVLRQHRRAQHSGAGIELEVPAPVRLTVSTVVASDAARQEDRP